MFNWHIESRVKKDRIYCQNLYAALATNTIKHNKSKEEFYFTFRSAAITVADIAGVDYLEIYMSGCSTDPGIFKEGVISPEVATDLGKAGWGFV